MPLNQAVKEPPTASGAKIELAASAGEALDLLATFGRVAPLEVDLGSGDGTFLTQLAAQQPERNFLGIEQMAGRVRGSCKKVTRDELTNVRILRSELAYAVEHLFPPDSVSTFYLLFPDPWPKRRHHRKRIVTEHWLRSISRALTLNGIFRIATDHEDYFTWMQRRVQESGALEMVPSSPWESLPMTTFESRFLEQGVTIHRLSLRKVSPPR